MPRKSLERLLEHDFDTLTVWEQYRLLSAMLRVDDTYRPFHVLFKRELPRCGARCRDGHPCQPEPPAMWRPAASCATVAVACMGDSQPARARQWASGA